ncbi:MAG: secretin N-terminal domain-containing protein [Candidatus Brocadiia bacterium]
MKPTRVFVIAGVLSLALVAGVFAAPPPTPVPAVAKPEEMVTINFAGVTLHAVVQYLSEFTHKPVLLPDKFPGDRKIDIVSSGQAAAVPVKKAAEILSTALRAAGYVMIETPYQIQIVAEGNMEGVPIVQDQNEGAIAGQTLVTITKEVKKADAAKLQGILMALKSKAGSVQLYPDSNTLIITEYGPQLKTMLTLIDKLDTRWEGNRPDIVTLEKYSVDSLRSVVEAFVKNMALNADPVIKRRLESFSIIVQPSINSFVLFGYPEDVARVTEFIRMVDVLPAETSRTFHTYRVLNRDVAEMVQVLNSVFTAVKARSAGAAEQCPTVIADSINCSLIVIASPDRYAEYLPLFKQIDKPRDQVQIQSAIVELSTDRMAQLGVQLATADVPTSTSGVIGAAATTFGLTTLNASGTGETPVPPANGGLTAAVFKNLNIPAIVQLSLQDQSVVFIAGPLVTTNDNSKATVDISEEKQTQQSIISPEGTTSGVTSGPPVTASISLEITPHINDEGTVRMEIVSLTEEFEPTTITTAGVPLYNKNSRKATTQVTVPDGATIVIGGLTNTNDTKTVQKVPFLGDIPILGYLFRNTTTELQHVNLCIFITPHVIRTKGNMAQLVGEQKAQLKAMNESVPELQDDSVTKYVAPEPAPMPSPGMPPSPESK